MTQIAIVVYPRFTALDLVGPYEVLRGLPGADIRFVAHEPGPVVADSGVLAIGATHAFDETPSPDIVLVPGGPGSASAARDEGLLSWLRTVSPGADWTASVCTGSVVLAAAGLLEGRRATTHWSSLRLLRVVRDADVIARARADAEELVGEDPTLETWPGLATAVRARLAEVDPEFLERA